MVGWIWRSDPALSNKHSLLCWPWTHHPTAQFLVMAERVYASRGSLCAGSGPGQTTAATQRPLGRAGTAVMSLVADGTGRRYRAELRSRRRTHTAPPPSPSTTATSAAEKKNTWATSVPTLECHDVITSETWMDTSVATSELDLGYDDHSWSRRDRGSLGGEVACAVRSPLLPAGPRRHRDAAGPAARRVGDTGRPPNDDAAIHRIAAALSAV